MATWTDQFVGDRMAVDRAFTERVAASEFTNQEWGTIMTAVELEVEDPESPEDARVVADTSKVEQVMPALEQMGQAVPGAGGGGGGGSRGRSGSNSGVIDSIKRTLGLGDDSTDQRTEAAEALADEYAHRFQEHLEEQGKWEQACAVAAASDDDATRAAWDEGEGPDSDSASDETE